MILDVGDIAFLRAPSGPKVLTARVLTVLHHRDSDLNGGKMVQTAPTSYTGEVLTGVGDKQVVIGWDDRHVIDVLKKKVKEKMR